MKKYKNMNEWLEDLKEGDTELLQRAAEQSIKDQKKIIEQAEKIRGEKIDPNKLLELVKAGYTPENMNKLFPGVSRKKIASEIARLMTDGIEK